MFFWASDKQLYLSHTTTQDPLSYLFRTIDLSSARDLMFCHSSWLRLEQVRFLSGIRNISTLINTSRIRWLACCLQDDLGENDDSSLKYHLSLMLWQKSLMSLRNSGSFNFLCWCKNKIFFQKKQNNQAKLPDNVHCSVCTENLSYKSNDKNKVRTSKQTQQTNMTQ